MHACVCVCEKELTVIEQVNLSTEGLLVEVEMFTPAGPTIMSEGFSSAILQLQQ